MFWTIIITLLAVVFFFLAKSKRESTGSVRNFQSYSFVIFTILAVILWVVQFIRSI